MTTARWTLLAGAVPLAWVLLLSAGVACGVKTRAAGPPDPAYAALAVVDAGQDGDAATPSESVVKPAVVDLLHSVECVVAVSSKVDNPKDFPEHLVDGKNETAWNSKTGDLHGYIAFRVPKVARVTRVELTVGFVKVNSSGDLFTKNHRIEKVRLSREGKLVKEVVLDPDERALQGFDLDEEGGDFKLEVLSTRPGTEKTWQELTVSEFRVLGLANGAPASAQHVPAMAIGGLDGVKPHEVRRGDPPLGPFASVRDLCAAYDTAMAPLILAAFPGDRYPGKIDGPHCVPIDEPKKTKVRAKVAQGPFRGGQFVRVNDTQEEKARLVLETERGVSLTNVVLWSRYHGDPGCGHAGLSALEDAKLLTTSVGRATLIVRIARTDVYWLGMSDFSGTIETAYACAVDDHGAASCEGPVVMGRSPGWPPGWNVTKGTFPDVDLDASRWSFRREPTLGPAGDLR